MSDPASFALVLLIVGGVGLLALGGHVLAERIRVPAPLLVLAAAAVAVRLIPVVHVPPEWVVGDVVTVALVLILFDGGMEIGWSRFRSEAGTIVSTGILGTAITAIGAALVVRLLGLPWYAAALVATAVAPTDPAVVFSVLGRRGLAGRGATILRGEAGANDPVSIALMVSLIAAGGLSWSAGGEVVGRFVMQLVVGAVIGLVGGLFVRWMIRRIPLPGTGLQAVRTLATALAIFGVAGVAHGSGFLAVFVAGILVGERTAPYTHEIGPVHAAGASLAEIVAFVVLGLTVDLHEVFRPDVWIPGLVLGILLALVVRPLAVGPLLHWSGLSGNEQRFICFAGLKGAVPILLGNLVVAAALPHAARIYAITVVVVVFSVLVQGTLVPVLARRWRLPAG